MKLRRITIAVIFSLLPFAGAFGADDTGTGGRFYGDIGGTGEIASVNGSKAKFSEYKDMNTVHGGFFGDVRLGYDSDDYWLKFKALDPGYHTQDYQLDGGMYGKFKFNGFYNEIIHNTTSDALTPYSGIGSNRLTTPLKASGTSFVPSDTAAATWSRFDYAIQRNQYGGGIKIDALNPFYFNVAVSREDRSGVLPWSNGGIGGGNAIEIPAPVKYQTTDYMGEIGYRANPLFAAMTFSYGEFTNANQSLFIDGTGPVGTGSRAALVTLPPDNHFYKLGFKSVLQLPLNSRFNVSLSDQYVRSRYDLSDILNFDNGVNPFASRTVLSSTFFRGRKEVQNYAFSLTSNPVRFFDFKLFYKYYSTTNKSDVITQTLFSAGVPPQNVVVPLFDYKKNSYGVDLGFKLPESFRFNAGYAFIITDRRTRTDINDTSDNLYSAELRWNGLDFLTPKISYERLTRYADYGPPYALDASASHINFLQFTTSDAATQTRNTYKAAVDAAPLENLNLGVAYKYKKSTFPHDFLGVQNAKTHEFETYGDYLIGRFVRVNAYFDLQNMRQYLVDFNGSAANVGSSPSSSQYMWNTHLTDNTYEFGTGVEFYLVPKKLTLKLQYDFVNSDGSENFSFMFPGVIPGVNANNPAVGSVSDANLSDVDSYRKSSFLCKLNYAISKSVTLAIGAVFEQYKYNDFAFSPVNYAYVYPPNSTSNTYLSGAYVNPSYNASIGFVSLAYKF